MLDATTTAIVLIYAALGCLIAGIAVTYDIWRHSAAKLPKMQLGELAFFGLFVVVLWPYLAIRIAVDEWRER